MSKEGNAESKKWLMYINRTIFFMFCFNISKVLLLLFVLCVLKSVLTLSNLHWKYQEFLVESVRIMSGMSGIHDRNLEWQP